MSKLAAIGVFSALAMLTAGPASADYNASAAPQTMAPPPQNMQTQQPINPMQPATQVLPQQPLTVPAPPGQAMPPVNPSGTVPLQNQNMAPPVPGAGQSDMNQIPGQSPAPPSQQQVDSVQDSFAGKSAGGEEQMTIIDADGNLRMVPKTSVKSPPAAVAPAPVQHQFQPLSPGNAPGGTLNGQPLPPQAVPEGNMQAPLPQNGSSTPTAQTAPGQNLMLPPNAQQTMPSDAGTAAPQSAPPTMQDNMLQQPSTS